MSYSVTAEFNNTYEEGPDANLRNFKHLYKYDFFQLAQNVVIRAKISNFGQKFPIFWPPMAIFCKF